MHLNGNVERNIVIVSLSHGWSQGKLLVTKSTSKFSFELASSKARVTSMRFQQQRWVSFSLLQGQTIIRLGCYKYGSTKTPVIIKVDWVLTLNAWDCCRNNLHFRVLFWPPEPAVWELFGFCWFASVCWIERGHFDFQTFPWLLDEKRFLLAKDILYQFQTQKKNILGRFQQRGSLCVKLWKGFQPFLPIQTPPSERPSLNILKTEPNLWSLYYKVTIAF